MPPFSSSTQPWCSLVFCACAGTSLQSSSPIQYLGVSSLAERNYRLSFFKGVSWHLGSPGSPLSPHIWGSGTGRKPSLSVCNRMRRKPVPCSTHTPLRTLAGRHVVRFHVHQHCCTIVGGRKCSPLPDLFRLFASGSCCLFVGPIGHEHPGSRGTSVSPRFSPPRFWSVSGPSSLCRLGLSLSVVE